MHGQLTQCREGFFSVDQIQPKKEFFIGVVRVVHFSDLTCCAKTEFREKTMGSLESTIGPEFNPTETGLASPIDSDLHELIPPRPTSVRIGQIQPFENTNIGLQGIGDGQHAMEDQDGETSTLAAG